MTDFLPSQIEGLRSILIMGIASALLALVIAPVLIKILTKLKIVRTNDGDPTMSMDSRESKTGTPIMGGLVVVISVAVLVFFFDWERRFTWVPIAVMLLSALLGAIDDLLSSWGQTRRARSLAQTLRLAKVHKSVLTRIWLLLTVPWVAVKNTFKMFGSKPGKGVHVHEKLILQFAAGAIAAWWIYLKLGENWRDLYIPFVGLTNVDWLIVPLIIGIVMFTANAVNITDGMDGLAGGMLIPTFGALAFLSWVAGINELAILNSITAGALVTYTFFNVKPARFQMGDVGSLALGSLLAINALAINSMAILPLLAFVFYAEAVSVMIQVFGRVFLGRRIFKMAPLHHHFELSGWSEEKTIMRFWIIHVGLVMIGIWIGLH